MTRVAIGIAIGALLAGLYQSHLRRELWREVMLLRDERALVARVVVAADRLGVQAMQNCGGGYATDTE